MRWKQADFLAGLFVIGGFALIIAIVVVVRGQIGAPDRYHTFFKNVAGLRAGAAVVYEGYIIGSVSDVDPVPDETGMQFRVNLEVEKDWVIPSDSVAEISAVSLLSANAIQISAGTAAPLAPGSEIDSITAVNVMAEISKTADELTDIAQSHLAPLLVTLRDVLDTEGRGALSSVSVLSGALAEDAPENHVEHRKRDSQRRRHYQQPERGVHQPDHQQCRDRLAGGREGGGGCRRRSRPV